MSEIQIPQTMTREQAEGAQMLMDNVQRAIGDLQSYAAPQMGTRYLLDDGETTADYGGPENTPLELVCPWCGATVGEDALYDREIAERWTYAEIDGADRSLRLDYDGRSDFDSLQLVHESCGLPVALPEGWVL